MSLVNKFKIILFEVQINLYYLIHSSTFISIIPNYLASYYGCKKEKGELGCKLKISTNFGISKLMEVCVCDTNLCKYSSLVQNLTNVSDMEII